MAKHVNKICSTGYHQLSNLWAVASSLNHGLRKQLVCVLIFSRIDYCNSLLYGVNKRELIKIQRLINASVRFIYGKTGQTRNDGFSNLYKQCHILPIQYRIFFKIALQCQKILIGKAPKYLTMLVKKREFTVETRQSKDTLLFDNLYTEHIKYRENRFSMGSPKVWNRLPFNIRSCKNTETFKKLLKTYYFTEYYSTVKIHKLSNGEYKDLEF